MIYFNMIVALFIKHLQVLTYYGMILFPGNGATVAFILLSFMKKYTDEEPDHYYTERYYDSLL